MEFKQAKLPNGLTIIGEINPAAQSLAAGFFVRTGSRDETANIAGVSHFLEHMMFKGTARRAAMDIHREFDELGAMYNAFTSEENTVYYAAVLPEFQVPILDLLGDMLRPALRVKDFDTEKKVILEEIALYDDRPMFRLFEKLMAQHFGPHPLSHSVLGTPESITALRRDDMLEYFNRRYAPGNVTLVGVGKIEWDSFVTQAEQSCGGWVDYVVGRETSAFAGTKTRAVVTDPKLTRQHVGMIAAAPPGQDDRRYAAHVLACILGDATGSRLYYALVDPAIAEDASVAYEEMDGAGGFLTMITSEPRRAAEALAIARREFDRFQQDGPTEAEMTAARNKIASGATLNGELPMGRLTAVGFDWVYRKCYRPLSEHLDRLLSVSAGQVHDLAKACDLNLVTILGLGPNQKLD